MQVTCNWSEVKYLNRILCLSESRLYNISHDTQSCVVERGKIQKKVSHFKTTSILGERETPTPLVLSLKEIKESHTWLEGEVEDDPAAAMQLLEKKHHQILALEY